MPRFFLAYASPLRLLVRASARALSIVVPVAMAAFLAGCPPPAADECEQDADCPDQSACVTSTASSQRFCAETCGADTPCPSRTTCVSSGSQAVCVEITGFGREGDICEGDVDCETGACVGDEGGLFCAALCEETADCPEEQRCHLDGVRKVCLRPLDNRIAGEACTSPRECVSGRCVDAEGGDNAVCVDGCVDDACGPGLICVQLEVGTDACVDAQEDGESCVSPVRCVGGRCIEDIDGSRLCTRACGASCEVDWLCVEDDQGAPICMPMLDDRVRGESCDIDRECASELCITYGDGAGGTFAVQCAVLCSDGCLADEMCWPDPDFDDVCGPIVD